MISAGESTISGKQLLNYSDHSDSHLSHSTANPLLINPCSQNPYTFSKTSMQTQQLYPGIQPLVYGAIYSGIPVYEMMCRNVAVMRRRSDSYLNATQILKVAGKVSLLEFIFGIDKGKRTKILEKEILNGLHEKVQGGYGKYQGTWIPFERGLSLAIQHGVDGFLKPLLQPEGPNSPNDVLDDNLFPPNHNNNRKKKDSYSDLSTNPNKRNYARKSNQERSEKQISQSSPSSKRHKQADGELEVDRSSSWQSQSSLTNTTTLEVDLNPEKFKASLVYMFSSDDPSIIPEILINPAYFCMNYNVPIDVHGNTATHWAATLGKYIKSCDERGADISRLNQSNETPLIRAIMATNNFDLQIFPEILTFLADSIHLTDTKSKSVLHHICSIAAHKNMIQPARYYLECVLEKIALQGGDYTSLVDIQDDHGDTALNIAARIGAENLVDQLLEVGANHSIPNRAGLRMTDFGFEIPGYEPPNTIDIAETPILLQTTLNPVSIDEVSKAIENSGTGLEEGNVIVQAVQKMIMEMNQAYVEEMKIKNNQVITTQQDLRAVTKELADIRRHNKFLRKENSRLPELINRIKNLEKCLSEEWARKESEEALMHRYLAIKNKKSIVTDEQIKQEVIQLGAELAERDKSLLQLKKEIVQLKSTTGAGELKCKRIISTCCNIPLESVDDIITPLLQAVESDDKYLDVSQVATFMSKVKYQESLIKNNS